MSEAQERAVKMKEKIEEAAVQFGLNLTIYEGKIGFVDQEQKKIVMLWEPSYTMEEKR